MRNNINTATGGAISCLSADNTVQGTDTNALEAVGRRATAPCASPGTACHRLDDAPFLALLCRRTIPSEAARESIKPQTLHDPLLRLWTRTLHAN